jgi:hypothetical protein
MTPDERNMLSDLANKLAQTPAPPKDAEAEDFIRTRIGSRPDALYLMTQTVLIQNMALEQANHQIQDLQERSAPAAQPASGGSFLGQRPTPYGAAPYSAPPPPPPQYQYAAPSPSAGPSGAPSFLRGAAQTAAGVAAGALAFEGIRSLFSHPGYGGFGGGSGLMGGAPMEETVVNNYYDSPGHEGGNHLADTNQGDTDLGDNSGQYQDVDYDNTQDDGASYDTADDGGGFGGDSGDTLA